MKYRCFNDVIAAFSAPIILEWVILELAISERRSGMALHCSPATPGQRTGLREGGCCPWAPRILPPRPLPSPPRTAERSRCASGTGGRQHCRGASPQDPAGSRPLAGKSHHVRSTWVGPAAPPSRTPLLPRSCPAPAPPPAPPAGSARPGPLRADNAHAPRAGRGGAGARRGGSAITSPGPGRSAAGPGPLPSHPAELQVR